jgi:hypothetical protein
MADGTPKKSTVVKTSMLDMKGVQMWRLGVQCSNVRMSLNRLREPLESLSRVDSCGIVRS